jgi:hypothetical protein
MAQMKSSRTTVPGDISMIFGTPDFIPAISPLN